VKIAISPSQYRQLAICLVIFALLLELGCGRGGSRPRQLLDFSVEFGENDIPARLPAGETVTAEVLVKNSSKNDWPSKPDEKGRRAVNLSYHWIDRRGDVVVFDGLRTPLPYDVAAGESVRLNASIRAPDRAGKYTLEVTLVQEAVAWFPERDGAKLTIPIVVVEEKPRQSLSAAKPASFAVKSAVDSTPNLGPEKTGVAPAPNRVGSQLTHNETNSPPTKNPTKTDLQRTAAKQEWTVQVGAYPQPHEAERLAEGLRQKNHDAYIVTAVIHGREWHRVRVGRLGTRAEAQKLREVLQAKEGLKHAIVTNAR
jgi:cell division septation protein DedD